MTGPRKIITDPGGGFFQGIADHLKLVWRLWIDPRVNPLLKILPFGSLIYLISPFDIPTPIDDVGVIWLFTYIFIELCPPDVVAEHRAEIEKEIIGKWRQDSEDIEINEEDVVDAEFEEEDQSD
jgi:hypothetical protein